MRRRIALVLDRSVSAAIPDRGGRAGHSGVRTGSLAAASIALMPLAQVAAAALGPSGAAPAPSVEAAAQLSWRQFHGRASHQGANPLERTVGADNVRNLSLAWTGVGVTSPFGTVFRSSPAIAGGLVYSGDGNGLLYAFNAKCEQPACSTAATDSASGPSQRRNDSTWRERITAGSE